MTPRPTIIDCDPGTDDAIALWLALGSPELDVRLVTVAGGNVGLDRTTANARAGHHCRVAVGPMIATDCSGPSADFRRSSKLADQDHQR